jgi:hypothetical protein
MGSLGGRLLNLIVPKTRASACLCWYNRCTLPDGTESTRECCKMGGHLYCEPCGGG